MQSRIRGFSSLAARARAKLASKSRRDKGPSGQEIAQREAEECAVDNDPRDQPIDLVRR